MSLEDVEALLIKKALARFSGNVSHAANALGLSRSRTRTAPTGYGLSARAVSKSPEEKVARIGYEGRVVLLSLLAGLPGSAVALWYLWTGDAQAHVRATLTVLIVGCWLGVHAGALEDRAHVRFLRSGVCV